MFVSASIESVSPARVTKELSQRMAEQMFAMGVLEGAVALHIHVTVPTRRHGLFPTRPPNLCELARAVERCLTGIVFSHPAQVVRFSLKKTIAESSAVTVTVVRLRADDAERFQNGAGPGPSREADERLPARSVDPDACVEALADGH